MPIQYPVARGTVLLCDFNSGFKPPEMVKRRPAVVLSHRLPHRDGLCTVVPRSITPPPANVAYACQLLLPYPLPDPFSAGEVWVKADMLATVRLERLDLFHIARGHTGRRKYLHPQLTAAQMVQIERCVCHALGMAHLLPRMPDGA